MAIANAAAAKVLATSVLTARTPDVTDLIADIRAAIAQAANDGKFSIDMTKLISEFSKSQQYADLIVPAIRDVFETDEGYVLSISSGGYILSWA